MVAKKKIIILIVAVLAAALITVFLIHLIPEEHTVKGTYRFYDLRELDLKIPLEDSPDEHFEQMDIELEINSKGNGFYTDIEGNMNYLNANYSLYDNVEGNENKNCILLNPILKNSFNGNLNGMMFHLSSDFKGAALIDAKQNKCYVSVFEDKHPAVINLIDMYDRCFNSELLKYINKD